MAEAVSGSAARRLRGSGRLTDAGRPIRGRPRRLVVRGWLLPLTFRRTSALFGGSDPAESARQNRGRAAGGSGGPPPRRTENGACARQRTARMRPARCFCPSRRPRVNGKPCESGVRSASRRTASGVLPGLAVPGAHTVAAAEPGGDRVQSRGNRLPGLDRRLRATQRASDAGVLVRRRGFPQRSEAAWRSAFGVVIDRAPGWACGNRVVSVPARVPGARKQGGDRQREGAGNCNRRSWSAGHRAEASRTGDPFGATGPELFQSR